MINPEHYNKNLDLLESGLAGIETQKKLALSINVDESTLSKALSFSTVYCKLLPAIGLKLSEMKNVDIDPEHLKALKRVLKEELKP